MISRRLALTLAAPFIAFALLPANADASENKKKGGGILFVQFPMLTVFTGGNTSRHGTLSVDVGLYAVDDKMADQIKLYQPRLQDAYITCLQAYARSLNARSLTDTDFIGKQLQAATDRVLGRTGAKVLLGSIMLN